MKAIALLLLASTASAAPRIPAALGELFQAAGVQAPEAPKAPAGVAASTRVISLNAHYHYSEYTHDRNNWETTPEWMSYRTISSNLDAAGVEKAFLISDAYWATEADGALRESLNQDLAGFIAAHPGRFHGFCGADLAWSDRGAQVAKCLKLPGMVGVKLHFHYNGNRLAHGGDRAGMREVLEAAKPFRAVFLIHIEPNDEPEKELLAFFTLAQEYPELTFVMAHVADWGVTPLRFLGAKLDAADAPANVFAEISTFLWRGDAHAAAAIKAFGARRVVFGADEPSLSSTETLRRFLALDLPAEAKEAILGANGRALLARVPAR